MCGVDREKSLGFCREGQGIRVAKIIENFMWEEPCISGEKGCLAIFFSGCNLRCNFCQNYDISHASKGKVYSPEEFNSLLNGYDLTRFSCIDLITPTHFSSQLKEGLKGGFPIPVVWNCGGYEREEIIESLSDVVDVFLPDFKYYSSSLSGSLSGAEDYFNYAIKSIKKMRELKPKNVYSKEGILLSGVLIRHLVLPENVRDSFKVLDEIKNNIPSPYISLMSQFTPHGDSLKRKLFPIEYKALLSHAEKLGLNRGYIQDFSSADEEFIPKF